jgi:hypothetical protein
MYCIQMDLWKGEVSLDWYCDPWAMEMLYTPSLMMQMQTGLMNEY